jgi:hypothetical protein
VESPNDREITEQVTKALHIFAEVLPNPKEITPLLVQGWVLAMKAGGIHPEQIQPAVANLLQTARFFPTPAEFLEAVEVPDRPMASAIPPWADESTKSDPKYLSVHEKFLRATGGGKESA